ncbi:spore coat protein [Caldibacillus lycopersici]|uniref:Spore coat protein n=1 Tax=Perspicuibacillus lycopersici TaxID=1325689 RepID=A0AAE3IU83_9BACI|nr:spore coat protein [Perspicuibacillus lycopersici]MCU9613519.1 spore coat protein [Perspicuibacillus lycopersici]
MNYGAHELLEMTEALRTKAAEIEQHGIFANQCQDQRLKAILIKHQQQMMSAYQQGISLLQGRGVSVPHQAPVFHNQQAQMGVNSQNQSTMSQPALHPQTLSEHTIATLALNTHKSGSVMGMMWANECADPQLRMYHVNGANLCQEMAFEIWTWMNQNGYYQPPTFAPQQTSQLSSMFQPTTFPTGAMTNPNMSQTMNQGFNQHMQ